MRAFVKPVPWIEDVHRAYADARSEVPSLPELMLTSVTVRIPWVDPLAVFGQAQGGRTFFERPYDGLSMVGMGTLWRAEFAGKDRFERASKEWSTLLLRTAANGRNASPLSAPVGFAGFAFNADAKPVGEWLSFGQGGLMLPKILILAKGALSWLTLNFISGKDDDVELQQRTDEVCHLLKEASKGVEGLLQPYCAGLKENPKESESEASWKMAVCSATQAIRQGTLQKVVLARRVGLQLEGRINHALALKRMRKGFGECTLFAFMENEACFLGATPERLVSLYGGSKALVSCLAGSARRGIGSEEDLRLQENLLSDTKNRLEHAMVVDTIKKSLAPLCAEITHPPSPSLVCIRNIQHLHTPILGLLKQTPGNVLDFLGLLHPTPAVGGLPKEEALLLIRALEGFDRGWYAGPVGWVDGSGGGEMFVAIRSALLSGSKAFLYAGCGIMADSDPTEELEESRLKLEAMRWTLNGRG